jgi:fluoroquinolone resistance protein
MPDQYFEDKSFENWIHQEKPFIKAEYEGCRFVQCDFQQADLSESIFSDCEFEHCNLSLVKLRKTSLQDVVFKNCKMLGIEFDQCNRFGLDMRFDGCQLTNSIFIELKLAKTVFRNCILSECDFTKCDLEQASFSGSTLERTSFFQTNLEKADFTTAIGFTIDPEQNRMKKSRFSLTGLPGLLSKYSLQINE